MLNQFIFHNVRNVFPLGFLKEEKNDLAEIPQPKLVSPDFNPALVQGTKVRYLPTKDS